jgi:hypothetical protein
MSRVNVAASLLATVFGDLDRLGCEYLVEHGEVSRLDQRPPSWWTSVLLARHPDIAHSAITFEVEAVLGACKGDVVLLLMQWARQSDLYPDLALAGARFPLSLFRRKGGDSLAPLDGEPLADSHLHSGGSMPLRLFFSGLGTRPDPLEVLRASRRPALDAPDPLSGVEAQASRLTLLSGGGLEWDVILLLAAVRWSLRLLWFMYEGGDLNDARQLEIYCLAPDFVSLIVDGAFWKKIDRVACTGEDPDDLAARLNCSFPDDGRVCKELPHLIAAWQNSVDPAVPWRQPFVLGLLRAIVALSSLATSLPGEGLGRFADRFRLMGKIQQAVFGSRSSSMSEWKRSFLVETVAEIAPTSQVVAAEFRRTFKAPTKSSFKSEVLRELAIHNSAFAEFCRREHAMSLTMPVGFGRRVSDGDDASNGLLELNHALAGCEALISIAEGEHGSELLEAIWSIDVAGPEIGSSNWPFQVGAQLLERAAVDLVFTIHAGESFTSELNGVRRVGELFVGPTAPRRIGHALALSKEVAERVLSRGSPPISRAEAIMDLAWLHFATGSKLALEALETLSPRSMPQPGIDAETWVEAFEAIHDLDAVHHLLIESRGDRLRVRSVDDLNDEAEQGAPMVRAIGALAWGAPPEVVGCNISARLKKQELAAYRAVVAAETSEAQARVLAQIKSEGVIIESCPTSNVVLAGLRDYGSHPFWEWSSPPEPAEVTLSSDDPLHFGNNILREINALLATGKDTDSVSRAVEAGLRSCSGGPTKRITRARGYGRVVEAVSDALVGQ